MFFLVILPQREMGMYTMLYENAIFLVYYVYVMYPPPKKIPYTTEYGIINSYTSFIRIRNFILLILVYTRLYENAIFLVYYVYVMYPPPKKICTRILLNTV